MANHFLLQATIITLIIFGTGTACAEDSPILDTDGEPLKVGTAYHVLSGGWGAAGRGGLTYSSKTGFKFDCPQYVAQHTFWAQEGEPIIFYNSSSSQTQINEGSDVSIGFQFRPNYCRDTGVWKITPDQNSGKSYVSITGLVDQPGPNTVGTWFKIESVAQGFNIYKIVYCANGESLKGNEDGEGECQQLDAENHIIGPTGLNFLTLVPIDQHLSFFGFVFRKVGGNYYHHNNIYKRTSY